MIFQLLLAGAGVASAYSQREAAKQQSYDIEKQAEDERIASEGRELKRRQELNRALAANVVSQASSGISGEGTPSSIALESAKQVSLSEGMNKLSDRLKQASLKRQARNVRRTGDIQAVSTLLNTAYSVSKIE